MRWPRCLNSIRGHYTNDRTHDQRSVACRSARGSLGCRSVRPGRRDWQRHHEPGAAFGWELRADRATVLFDDLPADVQPETQAGGEVAGSSLIEAVEDPGTAFDRDARPLIGPRQSHHSD